MQIHTTGIGDITVHAIEDGHFHREPTVMFPESDPAVWAEGWPGLGEDGLRISLGCFLLATPDGHVLVDTGIGAKAAAVGGVGGKLPQALEALDVGTGDISAVVHTHLHTDHICGNLGADGSVLFDEASFHVHEAEWAFWSSTDHPAGDTIRGLFAPVVETGRVRTLTGSANVTSRISVIESPGHTPGHVCVRVDGGDGTALLITGDVTHHPAQARHPDWNLAFDVDKPLAAETRRRVFTMLADEGWVQASGHYPRPGIGRVERDGNGFVMKLDGG
jgi:glyoxylase-like metal-dependent hydrolase (beta-lactamase superfamily II)